VSFAAFDLVALDGMIVTRKPIEDRRELLAQVVRDTDTVARIRTYDDPEALFAAADRLRMEGIVVKASRSLYYPGLRCGQRCWVKIKTSHARAGEPRWT
jgi:bifunctional non-homologous end joining protein LigD